jgi:hypothetical protein
MWCWALSVLVRGVLCSTARYIHWRKVFGFFLFWPAQNWVCISHNYKEMRHASGMNYQLNKLLTMNKSKVTVKIFVSFSCVNVCFIVFLLFNLLNLSSYLISDDEVIQHLLAISILLSTVSVTPEIVSKT